jgi:maleylacetate reductase
VRSFRETRNDRVVRYGTPWRDALADELDRAGAHRVAVLVSPRRRDQGREVCDAIGDRAAGVVALSRQHVPREVVDRAAAELSDLTADAIVAVGGGSAIGLGKAVQLATRRIFICIPTTYSGSEMTSIYGIREGGSKQVGRDPRVAPTAVVYDPELTRALPLATSVVSLFNAMAHPVDTLYASTTTPEIEQLAEQSVRELAAAIGRIAQAPDDLSVRDDALHGAYLAGAILGRAGMALHHKLAHVVGGGFDLPHATTHTVLLPHVVAFNAGAAPRATDLLRRALGADDPAAALIRLQRAAGAPTDLASVGMTAEQAREAARRVAAADYDNPRKASEQELAALIEAARTGASPTAGAK